MSLKNWKKTKDTSQEVIYRNINDVSTVVIFKSQGKWIAQTDLRGIGDFSTKAKAMKSAVKYMKKY